MRRPAVQRGDPLLLQRSTPACELSAADLRVLWIDLEDTLQEIMERHVFTKSAGISAVQIGTPVRLAIIWTPGHGFLHFADPCVITSSSETTTEFEGCLSFFDVRGRVSRPDKIVVAYRNQGGVATHVTLVGWAARIALHEIDHMDGILYTERMVASETLLQYRDYLQLSAPPQ